MPNTESLFDQLYNDDKLCDKLKRPFVKTAVQRKFKDVFDRAEKSKEVAEESIFTAQSKPVDFNVESIVKARTDILRANEVQQIIRTEYKNYFGEEFEG